MYLLWMFPLNPFFSQNLCSVFHCFDHRGSLVMTGFIFFFVDKFLPLIFISLPVFLGLLLKFFLFVSRHFLPQNTDLLHDLAWVPLWVLLFQFFPFLLAEENVRRQGSSGSLVDRCTGRNALFEELKLILFLFQMRILMNLFLFLRNTGFTLIILNFRLLFFLNLSLRILNFSLVLGI